MQVDGQNHYGFIDRTGRMAVRPIFLPNNHNDIYRFSEGLAPVLVGDKWGFIDTDGDFADPLPVQRCYAIQRRFLVSVKSGDQVLYIDRTGAVALRTTLDAWCFCGGPLAPVQVNNKWGYIDKRGKVVIASKFEAAAAFGEGLARVRISGKYSFIDEAGKVVFTTNAEYANDFSGGFGG